MFIQNERIKVNKLIEVLIQKAWLEKAGCKVCEKAKLKKPEEWKGRSLREKMPKGAEVKVIICEKQMIIKNIKELYYEKKIFIVNDSASDDGWCIHTIDS